MNLAILDVFITLSFYKEFSIMTTATATATKNTVTESIVQEAKKAAKKQENYSAETTAALLKAYETEKDTVKLGAMFGKTSKSIIAKLSREKVYVKPTYKTKTGEDPISKEELTENIAKLLNVPSEQVESLEKANKSALLLVVNGLTMLSELAGVSDDDVFSDSETVAETATTETATTETATTETA